MAEVCRRFGIAKLEVFGSAARGEFVPGRSDVDLLVDFGESPNMDRAEACFGFKDAMAELFGCSVDLLTLKAIENRILRAQIERSKGLLYAA